LTKPYQNILYQTYIYPYQHSFFPRTVRQRLSFGPMAKKKTAAPPEQAAGPSLVISRNK
jgi:hypothetical protein